MSVYTHSPSGPLATLVDHFWLLDHHVSEDSKYQLFPDGGIEVMFSLGEPQWLFEPTRNEGTCFKSSWVSGMRTKSIVISHGSIASMIGVRFRPAGACQFLNVPMDELADRVIELDCIWGRDASRARERLAAAKSPTACFEELERILLTRLNEDGRKARTVTWIANQLERQPNQDIIALAQRMGVSLKQLQRLFRTQIGLRPKAFARIQRFQSVIHKIGEHLTVDWAQLAAVCGYYDQPHFIREFKEFTHLTPTSYLSNRSPYLNSVAVE